MGQKRGRNGGGGGEETDNVRSLPTSCGVRLSSPLLRVPHTFQAQYRVGSSASVFSSSSLLIFVLDEQVDGEDAKVVRPNEDQQLLDLRPRHGALPLRLVPLDEPDRGQLLEGEEAEADEMEGEGWRENEKSEGRRVV